MRRSLFVLLLLACSAGCSGSKNDPSDSGALDCPSLIVSCPTDIADDPSYANEVEPIIDNNCAVCHSPDGGYGHDLVTYAEVYNQAQEGDLISWISQCSMPPSSFPPLTTAERQTLLDWLACGAPDN